jgi:prepilin-type N-terminal cleavage/methylation domain-containing protein
MRSKQGFTLMEMLVAVAVIGILAALLLPGLNRAKGTARRTTCLNNLKQVNAGVHMYADDHGDLLDLASNSHAADVWTDFRTWIQSYLVPNGPASKPNALFGCPADVFHYDADNGAPERVATAIHLLASYNFSSYVFNAGNIREDYPFTNSFPGIAGRKLSSIATPAETVLLTEWPALSPYSWHQPQGIPQGQWGFANAQNVVSFVDGHLKYTKIYWDPNTSPAHFEAWHYDPPKSYLYRWSGG